VDALRGLPGVQNGLVVGERQAGQKQADAFRRALQQHGDGQPPADSGAAETPTPSRLQRRAPNSRKEDHEVRHIDVYA
jgi:hypothetical protein